MAAAGDVLASCHDLMPAEVAAGVTTPTSTGPRVHPSEVVRPSGYPA
jgi:hypothetical protein